MFKKSKAFTLAEALIVIAVIGVISILTIPVYKKNVEKKGFEAALKKNYAILKNIFERYELDNYRPILPTESFSKDFGVKKALMPYLNVYYECKEGEEGEGLCAKASDYGTSAPNLNDYGQFVLNDGTLIMISSNFSKQNTSPYIYLDVNGYKKGPNIMGYDTYALQIMSNGELLPVGAKGTGYLASCVEDKSLGYFYNGFGCAYKILMEER